MALKAPKVIPGEDVVGEDGESIFCWWLKLTFLEDWGTHGERVVGIVFFIRHYRRSAGSSRVGTRDSKMPSILGSKVLFGDIPCLSMFVFVVCHGQ
eukprot:s1186_g13.t1